MHPRPARPLALVASVALTGAGLLLLGQAPASADTAPAGVAFSASAYGSTAAVGPVTSGRTAYFSACAAGGEGGPYGNRTAATDLGGVLGKVGAVVTAGTRSGSSIAATSTTGETTLLGGLVQAKTVASRSTSSLSGSPGTGAGVVSSGSSVVTGLTIAGLPRAVPAGVGAKVEIPGVATVRFNTQTTTTTYTTRQLTVEALRVEVPKGNKLGLPSGSIVVGSATSGISAPTSHVPGGQAYGTTVKVGGVLTSDQTAYVAMPCGGTGGAVTTKTVVGLTLPGLARLGTVTSTGRSVEAPGTTTAVFSSTAAGLDLLGGAVTAEAVTAKATTTRSASGLSSTNEGTTIRGLKVLGQPVAVPAKDNATVPVAGIGTLTLRKTLQQPTGLDVVALELKLSTDHLGLRAGTVLQVAAAKSRVAAG